MGLHAVTIALAAFLLFLVQPIVARQLLPWFGGSSAVWAACLVFFQNALLAGYLYSDLSLRRVSPRRGALVHMGLLAASLAALPIGLHGPSHASTLAPALRIILTLAFGIGLPFLVLATTGPLLQGWLARERPDAQLHRLYALSNGASLLSLVAYPAWIERRLGAQAQSLAWSAGYGLFVVFACLAAWRSREVAAPQEELAGSSPPDVRAQLTWFGLAALASALLSSITSHLTQDIAPVPFLWVLPLALYLATFVLCFEGESWYRPGTMAPLAGLFAMAMMLGLDHRLDGREGILPPLQAVPLYGAGLFLACMLLHGELVARRPSARHLSRFYLMLSAGGAAGGMLVGLVSPALLDDTRELPILLLGVGAIAAWRVVGAMRKAVLVALAVSLGLFGKGLHNAREDTLETRRDFFGTLRVREVETESGRLRTLAHGAIVHGEQWMDDGRRREPTAYFGRTSGVGRTLEWLRSTSREGGRLHVGIIGLGAGTLASYARAGDRFRIYELSPLVVRLARERFTFLSDSAAATEILVGDARLTLQAEPPQRFDLIVVDAFSGDAIPVHLLDREAMELYHRHLKPGGAVAFHVSNRFLDLSPVTRALADDAGFGAYRVIDEPEGDALYKSTWVVATANGQLGQALAAVPGATPLPENPVSFRPWTDDASNLLDVLR